MDSEKTDDTLRAMVGEAHAAVVMAAPYGKLLREAWRVAVFADDLSPEIRERLAVALERMVERDAVGVRSVVRALVRR